MPRVISATPRGSSFKIVRVLAIDDGRDLRVEPSLPCSSSQGPQARRYCLVQDGITSEAASLEADVTALSVLIRQLLMVSILPCYPTPNPLSIGTLCRRALKNLANPLSFPRARRPRGLGPHWKNYLGNPRKSRDRSAEVGGDEVYCCY